MENDKRKQRVAIVHDWAWKMRGAERCLEIFCELYPDADVYMLFGDRDRLSASITKHKIYFSWLNKLPFIEKYYRYTLPLLPAAIESFDLQQYDLVISSSACVAKGAIQSYKATHICYMYTPMRYAWDQTWDYFSHGNFPGIKMLFIQFILTYLRVWDVSSSIRPNKIIAISDFIKKRVKKYYRIDVDKVIYPPVNIPDVELPVVKGDYYIAIAPFEPNKGGEIIIDTAKKLGIKLILLGEGSKKNALERRARGAENIIFKGWVSENEKYELLSKAKAFLFCGVEDFGIAAVESMACGTPVIALSQGGALETIENGKTGLFFNEKTSDSLVDAITRFSNIRFDSEYLRNYARKFSRDRFVEEFKEYIDSMLRLENNNGILARN